jgi:hypothetical protein
MNKKLLLAYAFSNLITLSCAMHLQTIDDLPDLCANIAQHLLALPNEKLELEKYGLNKQDGEILKHISLRTTCPFSLFTESPNKHLLTSRKLDRFFARYSDALICDPEELKQACIVAISALKKDWYLSFPADHQYCFTKEEEKTDIDFLELLLNKFPDIQKHIEIFYFRSPAEQGYYVLSVDKDYLTCFDASFGFNLAACI